jgi:hypothetical protein
MPRFGEQAASLIEAVRRAALGAPVAQLTGGERNTLADQGQRNHDHKIASNS